MVGWVGDSVGSEEVVPQLTTMCFKSHTGLWQYMWADKRYEQGDEYEHEQGQMMRRTSLWKLAKTISIVEISANELLTVGCKSCFIPELYVGFYSKWSP